MASRRTPQKEAPDLSKSSTAKEPKIKNSVNDAVSHVGGGKPALPFSNVFCIKKVISKGESVCKLTVGSRVMGTGFVLFDEFIMTCAHLFEENSLKNNKLTVAVKALFAYENQLIPPLSVDVDSTIIDIDRDLDYAVLKLTASGEMVPPGLLEHFGPKPRDGPACIIGHPGGGVKKMDLTYIIEKEKRQESAAKHVKDQSLIKHVNVNNIMKSDHVITYDTYMSGGASGSPMFGDNDRVVGLHSAGILLKGQKHTVIEYARPVLEIYKQFVENLRNQNQTALLGRIREITETNTELPNPFGTQRARRH